MQQRTLEGMRRVVFGVVLAVLASAAYAEVPVLGRILGPGGTPAVGVEVQLVPREDIYSDAVRCLDGDFTSGDAAMSARTDAGGRYRLDAPEVGLYVVRVNLSDPASVPPKLAGPDQVLSGDPILEAAYAPRLELADAETLRLVVTTAGGRPVAGALVRLASAWSLYGRWHPSVRWQKTDADGVASFLVLGGERLRVAVSPPAAQGDDSHTLGLLDATEVSGPKPQVQLPAATPHRVRVEDAAGQPVAGVVLFGSEIPLARTGDDGLAIVPVPAGGLHLTALAADGGTRDAVVEPYDPEAGTEHEPFVLTLLPLRPIEGRVIDEETREPVAGALVWVSEFGSIVSGASTVTGGAGTYHLDLVRNASLQLTAGAVGHAQDRVDVAVDAPTAPTFALTPTTTLRGSVVTITGDPVEGALLTAQVAVQVGGRGSRHIQVEAQSSPDGTFRLTGMRPGAYQLKAEADGFAPTEVSGQMQTAAGSPQDELEIVLSRGARAVGLLVDESDQPVVGATVRLVDQGSGSTDPGARLSRMMRGGEPDAEASSDAKGIFSFPHVAAGRYRMDAEAPGFAPASVPGIELLEGDEETDLGVLTLSPGSEVHGLVVDGEGEPLASVQIFANRQQGRMMRVFRAPGGPADAVSGADGRFEIHDLAAGEQVSLRAELSGYEGGSVEGVRAPNEEPARIVLRESAEVHGRVVDDTGAPVEGATVNFEIEDGRGFSRIVRTRGAQTGADGRFELTGVPADPVRLSATAEGYRPATKGVELAEGEVLEDVEMVMRPGARIVGTVTGADGLPAVKAQVSLEGQGAPGGLAAMMRVRSALQTWTDGDGRYLLDGLETGRQTVVASTGTGRTSRVLDIHTGTQTVDLRLSAGVSVSGRVTDAEGLPLTDVRVTLQSSQDFSLRPSAVSGVGGTFHLDDVSPGSYHLDGEAEGLARTRAPEMVEVAADPVAGLVLRMARGQGVVGRLLGAGPDDLASAQVMAMSRSGMAIGEVDFEGGYRISGLAPGPWAVQARLGDGRQVRESLELEEGVPETVLDLDFDQGERLEGEVVSDPGSGVGDGPLQGVDIFARGIDVSGVGHAQSDTEGHFVFEGLEPGRYRVTAYDRVRGLSDEQEADVPGPELRLVLVSLSLTGRVVDAWDGSAVSGADVTAEPEDAASEESFARFLSTHGGRSDDDGRFLLRGLSLGGWNLVVTRSGYATARQPVEILDDGTSVEIRLESSEGLWLGVRRADGAPLQKIWLAALGSSDEVLAAGEFVPDDQGRVFVSTVPPGRVRLIVQASGTSPAELEAEVPGDRPEMTLSPSATVDLRVPELEGDPARANAVFTNGGRRLRVLSFGARLQDSFALRGGRVAVSGLAAGTWDVTVTAADGRTWSGRAEVSGTGRIEVRLE